MLSAQHVEVGLSCKCFEEAVEDEEMMTDQLHDTEVSRD